MLCIVSASSGETVLFIVGMWKNCVIPVSPIIIIHSFETTIWLTGSDAGFKLKSILASVVFSNRIWLFRSSKFWSKIGILVPFWAEPISQIYHVFGKTDCGENWFDFLHVFDFEYWNEFQLFEWVEVKLVVLSAQNHLALVFDYINSRNVNVFRSPQLTEALFIWPEKKWIIAEKCHNVFIVNIVHRVKCRFCRDVQLSNSFKGFQTPNLKLFQKFHRLLDYLRHVTRNSDSLGSRWIYNHLLYCSFVPTHNRY